ncbi:hypothetical protein L204_103864 [Cryptococcus depauperatus]
MGIQSGMREKGCVGWVEAQVIGWSDNCKDGMRALVNFAQKHWQGSIPLMPIIRFASRCFNACLDIGNTQLPSSVPWPYDRRDCWR